MKIIIFGKIPPPYGGVTVLIKNQIIALQRSRIEAKVFTIKSFFNKYDIAHIFYDAPWKRVIAVLMSKLNSKKIIFTVTGSAFDASNLLNKILLHFADGVILLNSGVGKRYETLFSSYSLKTTVLDKLFQEGIIETASENKTYFRRDNKYKYLFLYAYRRANINGRDLYGIDFIVENIDKLKDEYKVVFFDRLAKYADYVNNYISSEIIYFTKMIDFKSMLTNVDIYIRPTVLDGSSVAIQEALMLNVPVIASDSVVRPDGVVTYKHNDFQDFYNKLRNVKKEKINFKTASIADYIKFCESL